MAVYWKIENHVSLFERKKKRKSVITTFAISGNIFFRREVFKHETEAMLTWVRNKLIVYWFDENVKNNWNQCISNCLL